MQKSARIAEISTKVTGVTFDVYPVQKISSDSRETLDRVLGRSGEAATHSMGCYGVHALSLASCLIHARALLEYVIFILWVRSVNKMLPSLSLFSLKNAKIVQLLSLT